MKPSVFETPTSNLYYKGDHEIISLQVLKALAAFAVVMIHTSFIFRTELKPICRNAVPLFFMITGYFLLNKEGVLTLEKIKHSIFKLLKIFLWANAFYFLYHYSLHPENFQSFIERPLYRLLYFTAIGSRCAGPLWYLNSILQVLITLYLAVRFRCVRIISILALIGVSINLIIGNYSIFWSERNWSVVLSRNFFTIGIPGVLLGMCIRRFEHRIKLSSKQLLWLLIATYLLLYIEAIFILRWNESGDILFFTLPTSIITFLVVLKTHILNKSTLLYRIGRNDSLNIYIFHIFIAHMITVLHLYITEIGWVESCICTLLFSILLRKADNWLKAKWQQLIQHTI